LSAIARRYGDKLVIDPVSVEKSRKLVLLLESGPVYAATPNMLQAERLTGTAEPQEAARRLHALGLKNLVIHLGKAGAFASNGVTSDLVKSHTPKRVVDVTGAGDAAFAGLLHGLVLGKSWREAAELGQAMAARVIASPLSTLSAAWE
jgi:pseudouridine kinase